MLKTSKKILSTIMVVIMVLTAVPLSGFVSLELPAIDLGIKASAKVVADSGSCGDNVTYTYDSVTKELVISGIGAMTDYSNSGSPFYDSDIKTVVIEDGVTTVGAYAFSNCDYLTSVDIPNSVESIGNGGFFDCYRIGNVSLPDSVIFIGGDSFYGTPYYKNSS